MLNEAIFSLAIQHWKDLEVVVVLQNGTENFKYEVKRLIENQLHHKDHRFQIHCVNVPQGEDGRSAMLNYGIRTATGRYLAFLDDDDIIYHHGYQVLIEQLISGKLPVSVGGCRTATLKKYSDYWYFKNKETPYTWGRNRYDLFKDNFIPIHSFVIDRLRVDSSDLYFDEDLSLLEDYDFLLRLCSKYEFDFTKLDVFVCEYRFHDTNSMPYAEVSADVLSARASIEERKKNLQCNIPVHILVDLLTNNSLDRRECALVTQDHSIPRNPQIIRRILNSTIDNAYDFFSRHPRIEKQMSKVVHFGWRFYSKFSPLNSDNGSK